MINIAIFASGNGSNAVKIIEYFKNVGWAKVALVATNRKSAAVREKVRALNVTEIYYPKETWLQQPEVILSELESHEIELVALAGFLLKIPPRLISNFNGKILNLHPALLPDFGGKGMYGMAVHRAVKKAAKQESGISIHLVNNEYDKGDILAQASTEISPEDTPEDIQIKVQKLEHYHYPRVIEAVLQNKSYSF
jgi:phosphoribosylglycinamide formyltransferase-1